ncbi:MAG TPA: LuxR C-terminal-related transcriptional regulator [Gaiellaceae bacterium]|jgi:LuxR family maltose regulon positive regulatory protein|nr:LuxR C-terminal-related transcriptional regulator [Gaiellaceae bacterium]
MDEVSRTALVNRLRAAASLPVAALVAPDGYGKTTLLAQWAARDPRPFSFVELASLPEESQTARIGETALAALDTGSPFVVVVDDADLLDEGAADLVVALIRRVPPGSTLALAGRILPIPSLPRLRANGALLELGPVDLAFTRREARALLQARGVERTDGELAAFLLVTEGWPAAVAADAHPALLLEGLPRAKHEFLRRTSILDRLGAPLCDAVLGRRDSARVLATLAPETPFLVPLDRAGHWFRHHEALRAQLRAELDELEPELVPLLERRAADWFEESGDAESALRCAYEMGDTERAAAILEGLAIPLHNAGRDADLAAWLDGLAAAGELERRPRLAALAAWIHTQRGDGTRAERALVLAGRDPSGALVRAARCRDGLRPMLETTEAVVAGLGRDTSRLPYALLLQGTAHALLGEPERADAILALALDAEERVGSTETRVQALTQRARLAAAAGDHRRADSLLAEALIEIDHHGLDGYPVCALTFAAAGRSHLLRGASEHAETMVARARRLADSLTADLPWLAAQTRIELAWTYAALRDPAEAEAVLEELDELLSATDLGVLVDERDRLAAELRATPANGSRTAGLTQAELRLLPLLATHLSFREIGLRFYLSRNTVKTQAISVYRKLGASSRSEAVERAIRLGLVEPDVDAECLIPTG